jgi:hypothetical protein
MNLIEMELPYEDHGHAIFANEEGHMLIISLTHEGVVMDAFTDGGNMLVDSMAMTAVEWFDKITEGAEL